MKTYIELDDDLVKEAFEICDFKTKKELISKALEEFVSNHKKMNLLDLKGRIEFSKDYDHKGMRERNKIDIS